LLAANLITGGLAVPKTTLKNEAPPTQLYRSAVLFGLLSLSGCAGHVEPQWESCIRGDAAPAIRTTPEGIASTDLSVLIYNVEGLPWPARSNRGPKLDRIGDELAQLREKGKAPDIVLLQEAFTKRAGRIGIRAGYPNIVPGPSVGDRARYRAEVPQDFVQRRRFRKGERSGKLLGSGLYILSDYPVVEYRIEPFSRRACAGLDCLANKGVMMARIRVPGVPAPVNVFTTHMNSQKAARVTLKRAHAAHRYQTDEIADFLAQTRDSRDPMIFGGDFNMRRAPARLDYFTAGTPYQIVRRYCTVSIDACDVRMSWDGDAPWLDTQDLQFFDSGDTVSIRPVRVEAMFDQVENGAKLSDHDGYLVTYRLSWDNGAGSREAARAISGQRLCLPSGPNGLARQERN
jgi:endonuclease/exonuclease/phosphatase family metal-dependent hydrolase